MKILDFLTVQKAKSLSSRRVDRRFHFCRLCKWAASPTVAVSGLYLMGAIVTAVILLIQDLDRPGAGFVRVSQQPMIDTAAIIGLISGNRQF